MKVSTGLRNYMLDTGSLDAALAAGFIMIYKGTVPATADAAISSSDLLCTIYSNGTSAGISFDTAAAAGVLAKAPGETWSQTAASAGGVASCFRYISATEHAGTIGALSTTLPRLQGTIATSGADLNLTDTTIVMGNPQYIDFFTVTLPTL